MGQTLCCKTILFVNVDSFSPKISTNVHGEYSVWIAFVEAWIPRSISKSCAVVSLWITAKFNDMFSYHKISGGVVSEILRSNRLSVGHAAYWKYFVHVCQISSWWRHQMETFSTLLALCAGNSLITGEFPAQRPVTRSFEVFFDLRLNSQLSKQSWRRWFGTPSCSLWRHCNGSDGRNRNKNFRAWYCSL